MLAHLAMSLLTKKPRLELAGALLPLPSPFCRFCGEQWETFFHWAMDCPRFISERRDIFNFYENDDDVFPKWELPMLLDFSHILDIAMAIEDPELNHLPNGQTKLRTRPTIATVAMKPVLSSLTLNPKISRRLNSAELEQPVQPSGLQWRQSSSTSTTVQVP